MNYAYSISLSNCSSNCVSAAPSSPVKPSVELFTTNRQGDSATLSWRTVADGNSPISHVIVHFRKTQAQGQDIINEEGMLGYIVHKHLVHEPFQGYFHLFLCRRILFLFLIKEGFSIEILSLSKIHSDHPSKELIVRSKKKQKKIDFQILFSASAQLRAL